MKADEIAVDVVVNKRRNDMIFEDTETTKYIKNEEGCVVGIMGEATEKKSNIVVMVGLSGMGKSIKSAMWIKPMDLSYGNHAITKEEEEEEKELKKAKKILSLHRNLAGHCADLISIDELVKFNELQNQKITDSMQDPLEHHKGKHDPCGLRQQFNRNGKKFR